jgi:hypothetical protein
MKTMNQRKEFKPIPMVEKILWETTDQWNEFRTMSMAEKYYGNNESKERI